MRDIGKSLRDRGMRMTPQRRRILDAVGELGHSTPDGIATELERSGDAVPLSTIYRTLEALEQLGVVTHTHLGHGSPTWHLAEHADHLHLVCHHCGRVVEADVSVAEDLAGNLSERYGFVADVRHLAVHGWCDRCRAEHDAPEATGHEDAPDGGTDGEQPAPEHHSAGPGRTRRR